MVEVGKVRPTVSVRTITKVHLSVQAQGRGKSQEEMVKKETQASLSLKRKKSFRQRTKVQNRFLREKKRHFSLQVFYDNKFSRER